MFVGRGNPPKHPQAAKSHSPQCYTLHRGNIKGEGELVLDKGDLVRKIGRMKRTDVVRNGKDKVRFDMRRKRKGTDRKGKGKPR